MNQKFFIPLLLISVNLSLAQLSVRNNAFIYVYDQVLFVEDDVNIEESTANIYLRKEAQILQGFGTSGNSGVGELSVYQETQTGVYEYDYWCSPVGIGTVNTTSNVAFEVSNIHNPDDESDSTNVISLPYLFTSNYDSTATELSDKWLYTLQNANDYAGWNYVGTTGNVDTGYGFTLKGSPNPPLTENTLDFRGRPNNGDISVDVIGNEASSLTGNPYPSTLDLKLFFVNEPNNMTFLDGNIYFWEQAPVGSHNIQDYQGGYATYSPGDLLDNNDPGDYLAAVYQTYNLDGTVNNPNVGTGIDYGPNNERRFAAIGKGFVVSSTNIGGGTIKFNNSMRLFLEEDSDPSGSGSVFKNTQNKDSKDIIAMSHNGLDYTNIINNPTIIPRIRINTKINDLYYRENLISFRENTNLNYNKFTDAFAYSSLNSDAFMKADNTNVVIKSVAYNLETRIPFCLKSGAVNVSFKVRVHKMTDLEVHTDVYIYDNINQTYTNISNGEFNILLNEGEYCDRFEITFEDESSLLTNDEMLKQFNFFQNNQLSQFTILNPNNLEIKDISLFDTSGKRVLFKENLTQKNKHYFSTKNLSDGIYIATIGLGSNSIKPFTKKVIVTNK